MAGVKMVLHHWYKFLCKNNLRVILAWLCSRFWSWLLFDRRLIFKFWYSIWLTCAVHHLDWRLYATSYPGHFWLYSGKWAKMAPVIWLIKIPINLTELLHSGYLSQILWYKNTLIFLLLPMSSNHIHGSGNESVNWTAVILRLKSFKVDDSWWELEESYNFHSYNLQLL